MPHSCDDHHITTHDVEDGDGEVRPVFVFPREPSWWRDDSADAEQQRQHVVREFKSAELVLLIDEVWMYVQNPSTTTGEVAQLVQAVGALQWFADICVGSLDFVDEEAYATYFVRYWQQRAARYLADAAWRVLAGLPAGIIRGACRSSIDTECSTP